MFDAASLCFPDSYSLAFFSFLFFLNEAHPLSAATQLFSASDGSVGVRAYHSFLSFFSLSLSFSLLHTHTHTHSLSLPTSSIITPPSIQDTAESWCCQPEPDALSHSHMRHLSGPPPPPCWSLSSRYTSVARVMGSGLF